MQGNVADRCDVQDVGLFAGNWRRRAERLCSPANARDNPPSGRMVSMVTGTGPGVRRRSPGDATPRARISGCIRLAAVGCRGPCAPGPSAAGVQGGSSCSRSRGKRVPAVDCQALRISPCAVGKPSKVRQGVANSRSMPPSIDDPQGTARGEFARGESPSSLSPTTASQDVSTASSGT